jgi:hypothetical protein
MENDTDKMEDRVTHIAWVVCETDLVDLTLGDITSSLTRGHL